MNNSQIAALLRESNGPVLIISHIAPDGDTLGSALALYAYFINRGIEADICCDDGVPALYAWLPNAQQVRTKPRAMRYAMALAVDCASPDRMGNARAAFEEAALQLCIDHHKSNTGYGHHCLVNAQAPAAAQIITQLLLEDGMEITQPMADCLYTGILTDSGQYSFDSTTADTLRTGAELVQRGAQLAAINDKMFRTRSLARTRIIGRGIENMAVECGGKIAVIPLTLQDMTDCAATNADTENLVNYALEVEGVQAGVLIKQLKEEKFKCSLRSSGAFDAAEVAAVFGGGGHAKAAGFSLSGTLQQVKDAVMQQLIIRLESNA